MLYLHCTDYRETSLHRSLSTFLDISSQSKRTCSPSVLPFTSILNIGCLSRLSVEDLICNVVWKWQPLVFAKRNSTILHVPGFTPAFKVHCRVHPGCNSFVPPEIPLSSNTTCIYFLLPDASKSAEKPSHHSGGEPVLEILKSSGNKQTSCTRKAR